MRKYLYIVILFIAVSCLPSSGTERAMPDEGLSTVRVVEIAEDSHKILCLPIGVRVHAPENDDQEPIIIKTGNDVAVNGAISILASSTEMEELKRRIIQEFGPEYTIEYCKNPSWGLEIQTHQITLARRPFVEGSLNGWAFMAMIPAQMASPSVSLTFTGEIRSPSRQKKAGGTRSVRTFTFSGSSANTASGSSVNISQTVSSSVANQDTAIQRSRLSSATFPLTGSWEKRITPEP